MQARFSVPVQTDPTAHTATCRMGTGSFPGVKSGRGVTLTPHPHLVPWSRKRRAIPLLPLWAIRPVQSLNACTRVHFDWTPLNLAKDIPRHIPFILFDIMQLPGRLQLKYNSTPFITTFIYIYIYIYILAMLKLGNCQGRR